MPISYVIDVAHRTVTARASGSLSPEDLNEGRAALLGEPSFDPTFAHLFDLRDVTQIDLSVAALERLAASSLFGPGVRRAFVCSADDHYNTARMFAALSATHGQNVRVFRDYTMAAAWVAGGEIDV